MCTCIHGCDLNTPAHACIYIMHVTRKELHTQWDELRSTASSHEDGDMSPIDSPSATADILMAHAVVAETGDENDVHPGSAEEIRDEHDAPPGSAEETRDQHDVPPGAAFVLSADSANEDAQAPLMTICHASACML